MHGFQFTIYKVNLYLRYLQDELHHRQLQLSMALDAQLRLQVEVQQLRSLLQQHQAVERRSASSRFSLEVG
jgi:hypothetical protein